jgi:hypothetical protein
MNSLMMLVVWVWRAFVGLCTLSGVIKLAQGDGVDFDRQQEIDRQRHDNALNMKAAAIARRKKFYDTADAIYKLVREPDAAQRAVIANWNRFYAGNGCHNRAI